MSHAAHFKSDASFKQHRKLHQCANKLKHDCDAEVPPPAPPPTYWSCEALEREVLQVKAYAPGTWLPPDSIGDSISIPISDVQPLPFSPFQGKSWNLDAEPFVPSQWVACCTDWESLVITVDESMHITPFSWEHHTESWIPGLSVY